jgi:putative tryptophan/tyrosine transport system substrate-binding protein
MLYNPGEDNNLSIRDRLKEAGAKVGIELVEAGCDNAADIPIRTAVLKGRAEAVFVPSGGMMQPAIPAISAAAGQIGLPIINSSAVSARNGLVLAGYEVNRLLPAHFDVPGAWSGTIGPEIRLGPFGADHAGGSDAFGARADAGAREGELRSRGAPPKRQREAAV